MYMPYPILRIHRVKTIIEMTEQFVFFTMIQVRISGFPGFVFTGSVRSISNNRHRDTTVLLLLVGTTSCQQTKYLTSQIFHVLNINRHFQISYYVYALNDLQLGQSLTLQCFRRCIRVGGRSQRKSSSSREQLTGLCRASGRVFIQDITKGFQPS